MERQQSIGVLLLFFVLAGWWWLNAPSAAEIEEQRRIQDSIIRAEQVVEPGLSESIQAQTAPISDSVQIIQNQGLYGSLADRTIGQEQVYSLENELVKIDFSSKGGYVKSVQLKKFNRISEDDKHIEIKHKLLLLDNPKNRFEYFLPQSGKAPISTMDLYFDASEKSNEISFVANSSDGKQFIQTYTLGDNYELGYTVTSTGFAFDDPNGIQLKWVNHLTKLEKNTNFEKYYSTVYFKEKGEDSDYCSCRGDDEENLKMTNIEWVSHVNQFFNTSLIAKNQAFKGGTMTTQMIEDDELSFKLVSSDIRLPLQNGQPYELAMYLGPNEFKSLKAYDNGLEEVIPFGRSIFGSINRWVIRPAFNFLSQYIGSKGIVIIVLIFILKMLLYPLMFKMLKSQALMGALKPEIAKLKEKNKDNAQQQQMETMKLYREYGVSPLGGCMPMVVQMPIWYALFRFFPASITFRQEPFLWATDLSSYDVLFILPMEIPAFGSHVSLFTILWAFTTLIYTYYNTKHMDMSANPAMKYVQYFMPLMFLFFFNNYASGLTCYMFFSNLINIAQTILTKKFVFDDEKLRQELEKKKAKPKKKGGFQSRLEEAMAQQQDLQKKKQVQASQAKKKKKRK